MGKILKGIDISTYQENIDYKKLKTEGIDFAIIRCGYGKDASQKDDMFETHYKGCKDAGILVGCYHYSYCTSIENAIKEAENCLSYIEGKEFDLPVFYDLEDKITASLGKRSITEIALRFCRRIEEAGHKAGVYANLNWFINYIDVYSLIDEHFKVWLAQWGVEKPTVNFPYNYWQYTNNLVIEGKRFDANYCYDEISKTVENVENYVEKSKSIEELAIEVINGKWGNGQARKDALGSVYEEVQNLVNKILLQNDIEQIARNVIKGNYGNGQARKDALGSVYEEVQNLVNKILA